MLILNIWVPALTVERNSPMCQLKTRLSSPMQQLNFIFFFLTWAGGILFAIQRGLETKIPASLCFLLLGCVNTRFLLKRTRQGLDYGLIMLAGLFCGFLADIVLQLHFLAGAAIFALGHICYVAAYCRLLPPEHRDCLYCLGITVPSLALILFLPVLDFGTSFMQAVVMVYAVVISLMTGKAWSNYRRAPSLLTKCILIGSILFFFSDFMLLFAFYTDVGRIANILCLNTYYPGQAVLAASIFLHAETY